MYRMATGLAPYASHPELSRRFRSQPQDCADDLKRVGDKARALDIRLSTHPGQYTVLTPGQGRRPSPADELEVQASSRAQWVSVPIRWWSSAVGSTTSNSAGGEVQSGGLAFSPMRPGVAL